MLNSVGTARRGWRGGEWMRGLGLCFTNFPILCDQGECWTSVGVGLCYVCVTCESGFFV